MSRYDDQQKDTDRLRQRLDAGDRLAERQAQEDVVIEYPRRLLLRAPGGDFFSLAVDDAGVLLTIPMGPTL